VNNRNSLLWFKEEAVPGHLLQKTYAYYVAKLDSDSSCFLNLSVPFRGIIKRFRNKSIEQGR